MRKKAPEKENPPQRIVLVGTYRGDQLKNWPGWYCWPLGSDDFNAEPRRRGEKKQTDLLAPNGTREDVSRVSGEQIRVLESVAELWLFQGTKEQKNYKAEFVGVKTREELVRDYGYLAWERDGLATKNTKDAKRARQARPSQSRPTKPHGTHYALFKTELLYRHKLDMPGDADAVIVRTKDFAKRSPKVAAQLKAYLESPDRNDPDLARRLPEIITKLRPEQLRVCEAAVQMSFWDLPDMAFPGPSMRSPSSWAPHGEAKPFIKWAGGKGQLLEQLDAMLPSDFASRANLVYVEPFVGGGAMLFHVLSKYPNVKRAVINDLNADLATCYRVVKENPEGLIAALDALQREYLAKDGEEARREMYLAKRERYNSRKADATEQAALFIFLNKTAFNGLYRVNSKGEFNVPFNKARNPAICDAGTIRADSAVLQKVEILCGDFAGAAAGIDSPAFFYFDPPYRPLTETAAFTAYSKDGFGDDDQRRLAAFCRHLGACGHQSLLSNSDPHNANPDDMFFEELYEGFDINRVTASRAINSNGSGRGKINELAIRNYKE